MRRVSLGAPVVWLAIATVLASCQPTATGILHTASPKASPRASTSSPSQSAPLIVTIWTTRVPTDISLWSAGSIVDTVQTADDRNASVPSCHPYEVTYLPCVSTSNSRAYFLDGDTSVRYLATAPRPAPCDSSGRCPSATSGDVTHVPGGASIASAFAVSPDDQRIAVSVFTFRSSSSGPVPVNVRLYVEDLVGGGNHIELFSSGNLWVWPIGWHDSKLVVAAGSPVKPVEGPYGGVTEFHVVDPITGNRLQAMGSATCPVVPALLSPAGTDGVAADGSLRSQYWSRPDVTFLSNYLALRGGAMLSLDGNKVAACCTADCGAVEVIDAPALGGAVKPAARTFGYASGGGWTDATHVIYRPSGSDSLFRADTTSPSGPITLFMAGEFAGRVPGGL
jgi:hypothetical protein